MSQNLQREGGAREPLRVLGDAGAAMGGVVQTCVIVHEAGGTGLRGRGTGTVAFNTTLATRPKNQYLFS